MQVWPLRFRANGDEFLFANEAGSWFRSDHAFLGRYVRDELTANDQAFLLAEGMAFNVAGDLAFSSFLQRWSTRRTSAKRNIDYVILVPTLRCNLSCTYCQVSRASVSAQGYDWDEDTLQSVLAYLGELRCDSIQIEFQGGEPLLRLDVLSAVREFCRRRFAKSRFVVCSNFQIADAAVWEFFDAEDTVLSTSIDGDAATHTRQRTQDVSLTSSFFSNIDRFIERFGPDRISALPTIDPMNPPDLSELLHAYEARGMRSIYLRPINRQGFARRRQEGSDELARWNAIHSGFIDLLVERNYGKSAVSEEYYFTHLLRRILSGSASDHVDIRNPNPVATNYVVVDYDGTIYPTDEARMMARIGQIDLSIGHVAKGLDETKIAALNAASFNDLDPDCQHCVYQPFCGVDVIDDISRYGRVDVPKHETNFCRRHLALFDKALEMISSREVKVQYSISRWLGVTSWPAHFSAVHA